MRVPYNQSVRRSEEYSTGCCTQPARQPVSRVASVGGNEGQSLRQRLITSDRTLSSKVTTLTPAQLDLSDYRQNWTFATQKCFPVIEVKEQCYSKDIIDNSSWLSMLSLSGLPSNRTSQPLCETKRRLCAGLTPVLMAGACKQTFVFGSGPQLRFMACAVTLRSECTKG